MTKQEWANIVRWLTPRYREVEWDEILVTSYYQDLQQLPVQSVWNAVRSYHRTGAKWAPTQAQLLAAAKEDHRNSVRYPTETPALPSGRVAWADWCKERYGEVLSMMEAAKREKAYTARGESPF